MGGANGWPLAGSRPRQKLDHLRAKGAPVSSRRERGKQAGTALCCRCRGIGLRQDSEQLHEQFDDVGFTRTFFDQPFQILHELGRHAKFAQFGEAGRQAHDPGTGTHRLDMLQECLRRGGSFTVESCRRFGKNRRIIELECALTYGFATALEACCERGASHYCWHFVERPSWTG